MKDIKQVIAVRKDLNMRKGKIAAQVAHACMAIFFNALKKTTRPPRDLDLSEIQYAHYWTCPDLPYFSEFIEGSFKKIVVYVNSEQELKDIYEKAREAGIYASLILDSGLTEFHGIPTYTTCAIGPWDGDEINEITGHLPLL